jgi:DNA invertase Pin-like site-specific DNA recombinase
MGQEQLKIVRKHGKRLTEEDAAQIKAHLEQGKSPTIIARYLDVHRKTIYAVRAKKTWRHVMPAENATPLSKLSKTKRRV